MDRDGRRRYEDRYDDRYDDEVHHIGRGESYRPGGSRPPTDTWNSRPEVDTYIPSGRPSERRRSRSPDRYRRRSRSPVARGRDDTYPTRARSPPPRRYSPRREQRARSPIRRRSRSPHGGYRSPQPVKRPRELSPYRRSPPPVKRERLASPRRYERSPPRRAYSPRRDDARSYRARSRTPPRGDPYADDNWRRRSPSPRPAPSGPASAATSRRSSPPIHPDRMSLAGSGQRSPAYTASRQYGNFGSRPPPRSPYQGRSPRRERSPPPRQQYDEPPRSFPDRTRDASPRSSYRRNGEAAPPPDGPAFRNGYSSRPPPSGPSRATESSFRSPPSGPSSSMSMSAHTRAPTVPVGPSPTGPRGPPGVFRDGPRRDFGGPPPSRRGPAPYAPPPRSSSYDNRDGPPGGPRGSYQRDSQEPHRPSFSRDPSGGPPPFLRHNNSTSTTYPRTQRFNNTPNYLATAEKIVPGGKALPPLNPEHEKRARQLEADAERIRDLITEKQKLKRSAVRDWEDRERESEREGLKSELAERHLEKLTDGEEGASGAAF